MIFGAILAGGVGSRMNCDIPKQFIELCGKPIIIRTLEKMLKSELFDYIIIAIHQQYTEYLKNMLDKFGYGAYKQIIIICGGKERIDTIENIINCAAKYATNQNDIILLHDAVRPFVSINILKNSIDTALKYGACVATVPAVDTMYILNSDGIVVDTPPRKDLFHGQSPDTFRLSVLQNAFENLSPADKDKITGTVQICAINNIPIHTVQGGYENIKITTEQDLIVAQGLCSYERE